MKSKATFFFRETCAVTSLKLLLWLAAVCVDLRNGIHTFPVLHMHHELSFLGWLQRLPIGKSDHASILLLPPIGRNFKQEAPVQWAVQRWSDQSAMLQVTDLVGKILKRPIISVPVTSLSHGCETFSRLLALRHTKTAFSSVVKVNYKTWPFFGDRKCSTGMTESIQIILAPEHCPKPSSVNPYHCVTEVVVVLQRMYTE